MATTNDKTNHERRSSSANPDVVAKNWEQRLLVEAESQKHWISNWGPYFTRPNDVPLDLNSRMEYFSKELERTPHRDPPSKYGTGRAFKEIRINGVDHRKQRLFQDIDPLSEPGNEF